MKKQGKKPKNYYYAQSFSPSRYAKDELQNKYLTRKNFLT